MSKQIEDRPKTPDVEEAKKAFLEQLRLINMSVVATCLLLFVGASFESNGSLDNAYRDARSIRLNAGQFVNWLVTKHIAVEGQLSAVSEKNPLKIYSGSRPEDVLAASIIGVVPMSVRATNDKTLQFPFIVQSDLNEFKETLADFKDIWDKTSHPLLTVTKWQPNEAKIESSTSSGYMFSLTPQKDTQTTSLYALAYYSPVLSLHWLDTEGRWCLVIDFISIFPNLSSRFDVIVPLQTEEQDSSPQEAAILSLSLPWTSGTFQESFPDLSRISKGLESLDLKQLEEHVGELRAAGSESVDLFGAKLPIDFLRTWGILILFGTQLYYYLHIRQFHKIFGSERSQPSFPWIACYESQASRFVYSASVTMLPIATAIYLPLHQSSDFNSRRIVFISCAVSASLLASLLTWRELDRAR